MAEQKKPLVSHIFTADPSARVFNDKIYIYPSHDLAHDGEDNDEGDEYQMEDYHILSLDNLEAECVDNGEALHMKDISKQSPIILRAATASIPQYLWMMTERLISTTAVSGAASWRSGRQAALLPTAVRMQRMSPR